MSQAQYEQLKARIRAEVAASVRAEVLAQVKTRFTAVTAQLAQEKGLAQQRKLELDRSRDELNHLASTLGASVGFWFWRAGQDLQLSAPIRRLLPGPFVGLQGIDELLLPRVAPEFREALAAALTALKRGTLRYLSEEFRLEGANGRWLQLRARVLASETGGSAAALSGTLADIDERKQLEDKRRAAERLAMHTERSEGLSLLAGGVAHDLNELLQTLIGNAELALDEVAVGSTAEGYVGNVLRVGRQAGELCAQLLAYAGHGRYVMQALDLNDLLRAGGDVLRLIARRQKVELKFEQSPGEVVCDADPVQLKQVLANLVKNACEASEPGSVVLVRVGPIDLDVTDLDDVQPAGAGMPGRYAGLAVTDSGYGMDEATRRRMFDPFFSTKFTGRGLGLAASAGIVRSHGGMFRVVSAQGRGTTVSVLLPMSWRPAESLPGLAPIPARQRFRGRLLVVDDHPEVLETAGRMLGRLGFQVYSANSGEAALKQIEAQQGRIEIVLMDLIMPGMGGEAACKLLRQRDPKLKVVLMTGYYDRMLRQTYAEQGFAGLLTKPFQSSDLAQVLGEVLGPATGAATEGAADAAD